LGAGSDGAADTGIQRRRRRAANREDAMSYNMSDDRIPHSVVVVVVLWLLIGGLVIAAVGCKTYKPAQDDDHWDNQGEVIP